MNTIDQRCIGTTITAHTSKCLAGEVDSDLKWSKHFSELTRLFTHAFSL